MATRTLEIVLAGDPSSASRAFKKVGDDAERMGKKIDREGGRVRGFATITSKGFGKVGLAATGMATAGVGAATLLAKSFVSGATDINESLSKNQVLFGKYADRVDKFSRQSAKSLGISRQAALEATGTFGNLFVALDIGPKKSAGMSTALTQLAADLASFNNATPEEAIEAIRSGLVGETEPLRRFGVNINDAALRTEALRMGLVKTTKEALTPQQKALAVNALLFKQTEKAQGDFARTSGGLANQQRILKAELADAGAELGAKLMPAALAAVKALTSLFDSSSTGGKIISDLGRAAQTAAGWLKNAWKDAVVAVRGFLDRHRDDVQSVIGFITRVGGNLKEALGGLVDIVSGVVSGDWKKAWGGAKRIVKSAIENLGEIIRLGWEVVGPAMVSLGKLMVRKLGDGLADVPGIVKAEISAIPPAIKQGWESSGPAMESFGRFLGRRFKIGLVTVRDATGQVIAGLPAVIKRGWDTLGEGMAQTGRFMVRQLVHAIATDLPGRVKRAVVKGIIGGLEEVGPALLGSPNPFSQLGAYIAGLIGDGVGKPLGDGLGFMGGGAGKSGAGLMGADFDLAPFARIGAGMGLRVSSGLYGRENSITSSGNKSYHGSGDAIDMAGSPGGMMRFFRTMRAMFGSRLRELIYTPGGIGIKDGRPYRYSGQVAADHYDHVHVAYTGPFGDGLGRFNSTAYGPPWGGINGEGVTATGVNLKGAPHQYGVAVDPDVIPLGTRLKISPNPFGYGGYFTAFDTGGAIQGKRIDFYDWRGRSAQMRWGTRSVTVSTDDGAGGAGARGGGTGSSARAAAGVSRGAFRASRRQASRAERAAMRGAALIGGDRKPSAYGTLDGFLGATQASLALAGLTDSTDDDLEALKSIESLQAAGLGLAQKRGDSAQIASYAEALAGTRSQIKQIVEAAEQERNRVIEENTQALREHKAALDSVGAEMKRQTDLAQSTIATDSFQKSKWIADVMSGQLGARAANRALTAGVGSEWTP